MSELDDLVVLGVSLLRPGRGDEVIVHADGCGAGADGKIDWKLPCTCAPYVLVVQAKGAA